MKISEQVKGILKRHNIDNLNLVIDLTSMVWDEKIKTTIGLQEKSDETMRTINANIKRVEKLMGVESE
jgi:hypothetical protein